MGQDGERGGEQHGLADGEEEAVREEVEFHAVDEGGAEAAGGRDEAAEDADAPRAEEADEEGGDEAEEELQAVGGRADPG